MIISTRYPRNMQCQCFQVKNYSISRRDDALTLLIYVPMISVSLVLRLQDTYQSRQDKSFLILNFDDLFCSKLTIDSTSLDCSLYVSTCWPLRQEELYQQSLEEFVLLRESLQSKYVGMRYDCSDVYPQKVAIALTPNHYIQPHTLLLYLTLAYIIYFIS